MPDMIRNLQIEDVDLLACDVTTLERLFSLATLRPSDGKQLRGSVILTSAWCDSDPRPNWSIPEWRRYLNAVFITLPHFSYFLVTLEQTYVGIVLALLPESAGKTEGKMVVFTDRSALVKTLVSLLGPVKSYCQELFDDFDQVLSDLLRAFPRDVAKVVTAALLP